jgi:hypothetical protein
MSLLLDALKEAENQARRPAPAPRVASPPAQPSSPSTAEPTPPTPALSLSTAPAQAKPELPAAAVDAVLDGPSVLTLAEDAAPAAAVPLPSQLPLPPPRRTGARGAAPPSAPGVQRPERASVATRRPSPRGIAIGVLFALVLAASYV